MTCKYLKCWKDRLLHAVKINSPMAYINCDHQCLIGIWIGVGLASPIILFWIVLFVLRFYLRGPTTGSDNSARLDGKVVAITGNVSV